MEFTTRLGLHSQATRLLGAVHPSDVRDRYGPGTLYGSWPRSRGTWITVPTDGLTNPPKHHISLVRNAETLRGIRCWAFPASLAATRGILVSFFSSAY